MKTAHLKRKLAMAALCFSLLGPQTFGTNSNSKVSDLIEGPHTPENTDGDDDSQPVKFLVNIYAGKGLCKVTTSPGRTGNPYTLLFDGAISSPWVSENVNPVFVKLAFDDYIDLDKIRILPGEPGYPGINRNDWWLEIADTEEDLNDKKGSYQLLIPKRKNVAGVWDEVIFSSTISTKIVRFHVQRTTYDNYVHIPEIELWGTPPTIDISPGDKFLIIVSSPLYNTGIITDALNDYKDDVQKEGWETELITVNSAPDTSADYFTPSEVELKTVIKSYYDLGFDGFVFIGSHPDIPTAYWKHHKNMSEYGYTDDPCDLFYADMDDWIDLDNNGVYETYESKWDGATSKWVPDYSQPANPSNPHFYPEMFYGRISAGPIVANVNEEAQKVKFYLDKLHQYRLNGSMLPQEKQKSAMTFASDEYYGMTSGAYSQLANHIYKNHGIMLCSPATLKKELERGYKFATIISHSGNDAHAISKWEDGKRTFAGFSLYDLDNTESKVHYINFFACYAAKFTVPNFGAHLLFNNDYALNVTGSSGGWGIVLDEACGVDINMDLPVGIMVKNFILRSITEEGWPKGILHGDPLMTYSNKVANRPPIIKSEMQYLEACVGETFTYDISISDPENEEVTITSDNLPENASINDRLLQFTPSAEQVDKTFPINLIAKDPHGNSYNAEITIYVNSFKNGILVSNPAYRGWTVDGSVINTSYQVPPFHQRATALKTSSSSASITQNISVLQNNTYKLVFWTNKNELTQNLQNMYWRIDELNQSYPVMQNLNTSIHYDPYIYGEVNFNSGNHDKLTVSFRSGDATKPTSGTVYLTGIRLINRGICDPLPTGINGEFTAGCDHMPYYWTQESFRLNDAVFTWEENGGIDNSKCISIDHSNTPNDSRWQQNITGLIPGAEYQLKGWIKGENIRSSDASFTGANLNINLNNTWIHTPGLAGTFDWKEISLTFKAPSTGNITIQGRLGHFGSTVTGKAWFDNLTLMPNGNPLVVNARGTAAGGVYAHFKVLVNGIQIGEAFTSSQYKSYAFPLAVDPATIREIEIVFDNDAVIKSKDRNLYVQYIELDGEVIKASGENVTYTRSNGKVVNYNKVMTWNGKLRFQLAKPQISVNARGTVAGGVYAHFKVLVDGIQTGDAFTSSQYTSYVFPLTVDPAAIRKVEIVYNNDGVIKGKDRNLYVQNIELDGKTIPAVKGNVIYTRSNGKVVNYNNAMAWNGKLLFQLTKPQISVKARGSAAGGVFAHFKVLVNGSLQGNAFTTSQYKPYSFPLTIDPAAIRKVEIVFDNNAAIGGKDRNLYVQSIELDGETIPAVKGNVIYTRKDGVVINYNGTMWWDGRLLFELSNSAARLAAENSTRDGVPRHEWEFDVVVFPNPNDGKFYVKFGKASDYPVDVVLYDVSGKIVTNETLPSVYAGEIRDFNILSVDKGIYILNILNRDISITRKISIR